MSGGCEDEDPYQWAEWCPSCARAVKELEAAEGKRCAQCLQEFGRYPKPSEEDPTLCNSCLIASQAPKFPRVGTYGTAGPVGRPPRWGLEASQDASSGPGVVGSAGSGGEA